MTPRIPSTTPLAPLGLPVPDPTRYIVGSPESVQALEAKMRTILPHNNLVAVLARLVPDGTLKIMLGQIPDNNGMVMRWHLSISHPHRNPTWEEIRDARYDLLPPHVTMAMLLPPTTQYVNAHEYCFHLHEIDGE